MRRCGQKYANDVRIHAKHLYLTWISLALSLSVCCLPFHLCFSYGHLRRTSQTKCVCVRAELCCDVSLVCSMWFLCFCLFVFCSCFAFNFLSVISFVSCVFYILWSEEPLSRSYYHYGNGQFSHGTNNTVSRRCSITVHCTEIPLNSCELQETSLHNSSGSFRPFFFAAAAALQITSHVRRSSVRRFVWLV